MFRRQAAILIRSFCQRSRVDPISGNVTDYRTSQVAICCTRYFIATNLSLVIKGSKMVPSDCCDRRRLFRYGSAAGLSAWLGGMLAGGAAAKSQGDKPAPYQRCITLWMQGGPSQLETFDPKAGTETGGPLRSVQTNVPGVQFCETLSSLARHADDLCVIRSVGSGQGEHERASH